MQVSTCPHSLIYQGSTLGPEFLFGFRLNHLHYDQLRSTESEEACRPYYHMSILLSRITFKFNADIFGVGWGVGGEEALVLIHNKNTNGGLVASH